MSDSSRSNDGIKAVVSVVRGEEKLVARVKLDSGQFKWISTDRLKKRAPQLLLQYYAAACIFESDLTPKQLTFYSTPAFSKP